MKFLKNLELNSIKDAGFLFSGTVIAQVIVLLVQPILKRMFGPEVFGMYDVYIRSVGIISVFIAFKFEETILLPDKKSKSYHLFYFTNLIVILMVLFLELLLVIFKDNLIGLLKIHPDSNVFWIYLIPVSAGLFTLTLSCNSFLIYNRKYLLAGTTRIYRRGSESIFQVLSGFAGKSAGLVLGDLIGNAFGYLSGIFHIRRKKLTSVISFKYGLDLLKEHSRLPKFILIPNLLNALALSAITFQTLAKFDIETVGYLELTQKILLFPGALISYAISQVVYQRVSKAVSNTVSFKKEIQSLFIVLAGIAVMFFLVIFFYGEWIFTLVFGQDWSSSGQMAEILIYSVSLMFLVSPFGKILIGLKKFAANSSWEILKFIALMSLFFIDFNNVNQYLQYYNIIVIFAYFLYAAIIIYYVRNYELNICNKFI